MLEDLDPESGIVPSLDRHRVNGPFRADECLAELHTHLGGALSLHALYELAAYETGVALPCDDYWDFARLVTVPDDGVDGLDGLDSIYGLVERIQSSPHAVERAVHDVLGGGYRHARITTHEIRFNPAKRNGRGTYDLDAIVLAACRSVDRAMLAYPQVTAGLILMCDRSFSPDMPADRVQALNETIVEKALRWSDRGVVGVDIGGPRPGGPDERWPYRNLWTAFADARAAGLGITVHCGEEGDPDEIGEVIETLRPHRIGHGVLAAHRPDLCRLLVETDTALELCPTSNLRTGVFADTDELAEAVRALLDAGVTITVNTDGPQMMRTRLRDEHQLLIDCGAMTGQQCRQANDAAHARAFVRPRPKPRIHGRRRG